MDQEELVEQVVIENLIVLPHQVVIQHSPLASATSLPVSVTSSYPITVGGGGAAGNSYILLHSVVEVGSNSIFSTITSAGGGGGAQSW
jgi:hypothetical protein